jgi:hypothetical protein
LSDFAANSAAKAAKRAWDAWNRDVVRLQISGNRRRSTNRTGTGQNGCWLQIRCKCSQTAHIADVLPAVGTILNTAAGEIAPSAAVQTGRAASRQGAAPPAFAEKKAAMISPCA